MNNDLREQVAKELCDLFYHHDYNFEELANYAVKRIRTATLDEVNIDELESCLGEAVDLMEDVIKGEYTPDSFTTQPWRKALNNIKAIDNLRGHDE